MLRGSTTDVKGRKDKKKKKERRAYSRNSIGVWFRVFRTMTRDAMVALDLPRDPTLRVSLPEPPVDYTEPNSLTPEQLIAFLEAMRASYPQHYALVATLAYTGLRFCHASALRWEDWDEQAGVLRVVRKHFRGEVGAVSRKKQSPKEYPVEPELTEILKQQRQRLFKDQGLLRCKSPTDRIVKSFDQYDDSLCELRRCASVHRPVRVPAHARREPTRARRATRPRSNRGLPRSRNRSPSVSRRLAGCDDSHEDRAQKCEGHRHLIMKMEKQP